MRRLTIFEGPDCSGKSTLAFEYWNRQCQNRQVQLIHHGPYPGIKTKLPRLYVETMLPMLQGREDQIWDRCWLSEPIYGRAFRHGDDRVGEINARHLERFALRHGAAIVLCMPSYEAVFEKWKERKGEEYLKSADQLKKVYDSYAALRECTSIPILLYDYTRHQPDSLIQALEHQRPQAHPVQHHTGGNWTAPVVLVGDKFSELKDADCNWRVPFGSFDPAGSSHWLTHQLASAEINEVDLLWVNADQPLSWLAERHSELVIALGEAADQKLTEYKIPHVKAQHPQYAKRFGGKDHYELPDFISQYLGKPVL